MASSPKASATGPKTGDGRSRSGITSYDVARAAGVSQSTVSRALRGELRVTATTRDRVREAALQLGYVPSALGRSLVTRSTGRVGRVVTDLTNAFYPHIVGPLHDELERAGYQMVLFVESGEDERLLEQLANRSLDGVVLATALLSSALPLELHRREVPFVFVTRTNDAVPADCAVVDNALGASLMAAELLRFGHRRIAAIFGDEDTSTSHNRERGLRAALGAGGVELHEALIRRGRYSYETGYRYLPEIIAASPRPTAVFCGNDAVAIGALDVAHRVGIKVPDELSVVGFDDLPMAGWGVFELTTVRQPLQEIARTAARLLVERVQALPEELPARRVVFEPQIVRRRTLGPVDPADGERR